MVIPKPPGQVTRIRRGGYTLIEALGWDLEYYKNVQELVHDLARRYLDRRLSYQSQDPSQLDMVCAAVSLDILPDDGSRREFLLSQAAARIRTRNVYKNNWHIRDFLRVYLHNTAPSRRSRPSIDHAAAALNRLSWFLRMARVRVARGPRQARSRASSSVLHAASSWRSFVLTSMLDGRRAWELVLHVRRRHVRAARRRLATQHERRDRQRLIVSFHRLDELERRRLRPPASRAA
ncbi:hypothetical protein AURDEDRAFT_167758 [Auricularia subglabra TFB-10046 SS5]|nr:hypothetical protein AURDEDRAFT_167758 [Auricularia subglabra TFB-10046 SS5]